MAAALHMDEQDEKLPRWFVLAAKMALHLSGGFIALFIILHWIKDTIPPEIFSRLNLTIIVLAAPCIILAGPGALLLLKKKNDG